MIKLIELEECASTNDEAWKLSPETALVLAWRQTQGRGRQGRKWETDTAGNIAVSLSLPPPKVNISWLPLAAGVAAVEALSFRIKTDKLRLKWPNDIMWETAKMGGILCESRVMGERVTGTVIGMGLNAERAPIIEGVQTASLRENAGATLSKDEKLALVQRWAEALLAWRDRLDRGDTEPLRQAWKRYAKLELFSDLLLRARALDLDPSGKLQVQIGPKVVLIDQADTF